jgi:hypothetical protein
MAISEALQIVEREQAECAVFASGAVEEASAAPHLFLLASASEEHVDRQAVRAVRRQAQQHRNVVAGACLCSIGAVFGLAMLMVQLAQ